MQIVKTLGVITNGHVSRTIAAGRKRDFGTTRFGKVRKRRYLEL